MPMTVVVTRDVAPRFRGFLASCMLEIAPGVYTAPDMTRSVRERVWTVLSDWFDRTGGGCVVLTWADSSVPAGQSFLLLGEAPKDLYEVDGLILVRREVSKPAP